MQARCAVLYREAGLPIIGSAPADMTGWLLLEHPGPWPRKGVPDDVAPQLRAWLDATPERVQLIRRVDGRRLRRTTRVYLSLGFGSLAVVELAEPDRLLDHIAAIDAARAAGLAVPAGFEATSERPLLVCTHGRRDRCCAQWGRPAAVTLAAARPDQVWETTHLGGHRFAVNLVAPPSPFYFGQIRPVHIVEVAESVLTGQVPTDLLRGRSGVSEFAQAAELFVRRDQDLRDAGAVTPGAVRARDDGTSEVDIESTAGRFVVGVRPVDGPLLPSSCGAEPVSQRTLELVDIRRG